MPDTRELSTYRPANRAETQARLDASLADTKAVVSRVVRREREHQRRQAEKSR